MVGGVFVFFGASRERSAERLTQIADWPENGLQSYTNIKGWLDTSLKHIATVLQAPRVLMFWEIAQEPYWFSALFSEGECRHDRLSDSTFGKLVCLRARSASLCHRNCGIARMPNFEGHHTVSRAASTMKHSNSI